MFEKLKNVEDRYEEINNRLMDPAVVSDNEQYKNLMKEYKNLTPIVEKYREYRKACASHEEAAELLEEGGPVSYTHLPDSRSTRPDCALM